MDILKKLIDTPELTPWFFAGVIAVSMALGAFIVLIFGVLPLKEQRKMRGSTRQKSEKCDNGISCEYYKNIINDLQNEIEFWQGNCKTAEDKYNKLYQEVHNERL